MSFIELLSMLRNIIQSIEAMDARELSDTLAEKRRALRVRSYAQVKLSSNGEQFKGIVTELGLEGLRIKSPDAPFKEGQSWEIHYALGREDAAAGPVRVQTAWVQKVGREFVAGARYADSRENMRRSWVRYLLQELGFDESRIYQRRQYIRVDASIPARMLEGSRCLAEGRLVNLGIGGALLESSLSLTKGSALTLEMSLWRILPTLRLPVTVLGTTPEPDSELVLNSLQFGTMDGMQIKILGNYIINMINQASS